MRIVHIVPTLDLERGGPSRSVAGLASAQASLGSEIVLVAGRSAANSSAASEGVDVRLGAHLPGPFEIPALGLTRELRAAIESAQLVHLHSLWNGTTTVAEMICRRQGKPFVLSPRGMLASYSLRQRRRLKSAYLCAVERRNLEFAAGFHFLDEAERRGSGWFRQLRGVPFVVIPNGLDMEQIHGGASMPGAEAFAGLPDAAIRLVFLGRLDPIKGLDLQVRTLAVLRSRGIDAHLYLVGPDYGEERGLRTLAAALNVQEHLTFVGPIYDARRLAMLKHATAVLLTSHYECNSRSGAEAMGVGGVLIAARRCHVDIAMAAGAVIGLPAEPEAFAREIEKVASDAGYAGRLREQAACFARLRLPWRSVAGQTLAFYERVLQAA